MFLTRSPLSLLVPLLACLLQGSPATLLAAPQSGVRIESATDGTYRTVLVRRGADGKIDARFGNNGHAPLDGLRAERVIADTRGNLLVVGSGIESPSRPVLVRLSANGQRDVGWGVHGISSAPPMAEAAGAKDALVLPDGRTLLVGQVEAPLYRAALWFVDAGGRFEPRWLLHTGGAGSRALSVASVDGGPNLLLALAVADARRGSVEAHIFLPARGAQDVPERLVRQTLPEGWTTSPTLLRQHNHWFWTDPDKPEQKPVRALASDEPGDTPLWSWQTGAVQSTLAAALQPPTAVPAGVATTVAAANPGWVGVSPFAESSPWPTEVARAAGQEFKLWPITLGGLALICVVFWLWRSR